MGRKRLPHINAPRSAKSLPSLKPQIDAIELRSFKWRILPKYLEFSNSDFGWEKLTSNEILNVIIPKLHKYEDLSWAEAQKRPHFHSWKTSDLDRQLRKLAENKGYDKLYQIDIEKACRIYGIKNGDVFFCVWYDPQHKGKKMS